MTFQQADNLLNEKKYLMGQSLNEKGIIKIMFIAPLQTNNNLFFEYLKHLFKKENIKAFIILNRICDFDVYVSYTNIKKQKLLIYESLSTIL